MILDAGSDPEHRARVTWADAERSADNPNLSWPCCTVSDMWNSPDDPGEGFAEEAAAEDLSRVDDDSLEASIPVLVQQIDALRAHLALRIAEYDRRRLSEDRHVLSTRQWLSYRCRLTKPEASTLIRTGRSLSAMPFVAKSAVAGDITSTGLKKLTAARDRHPHEFTHHESILADAATHLDSADLGRAIAHWEQQVAYPDAVSETRAKRARRRFSINQTWDGMWAVSGELDPEAGLAVSTALHAHVERANLAPGDQRSFRQKMADALADLAAHHLDHHVEHTSGAGRPHLTVTVEFEALRSDLTPSTLPELDGLPVEPVTVRRLACDAGVIPMVLGSDGEALDIGRATRAIPPSLRRALDRRDGGCSWRGCDLPPSWCDGHHIVHWADGGSTSLDNLILLCRRHHTAIHEGRNTSGLDPPLAA
jgi:hypothetical protein